MGFDEWTCMDGAKRDSRHFMKLLDGQELCFDVDAHMRAYYRAHAERHELWLVKYEPRQGSMSVDRSVDDAE